MTTPSLHAAILLSRLHNLSTCCPSLNATLPLGRLRARFLAAVILPPLLFLAILSLPFSPFVRCDFFRLYEGNHVKLCVVDTPSGFLLSRQAGNAGLRLGSRGLTLSLVPGRILMSRIR